MVFPLERRAGRVHCTHGCFQQPEQETVLPPSIIYLEYPQTIWWSDSRA